MKNLTFESWQAFYFQTAVVKPLVMLWALAFMHCGDLHVRSFSFAELCVSDDLPPRQSLPTCQVEL